MSQKHREIIDRIQASSMELVDLINSIPESLINTRPEENEWSVFETLVHIRNVAMFAYGMRIRRLVSETDPLFGDYDEESDNLADMKKSQPVGDVLEMITAEQEALSQVLGLLSEDAWERSGTHPRAGRLSIAFLATRIAEHADEHIGQIRDTYQALSN